MRVSWISASCGSAAVMAVAIYLAEWHRVDPWTSSGSNSLGVLLLSLVWTVGAWLWLYRRLGICPTLYHSSLFKPTLADGEVTFRLKRGVIQCFLGGCLQFSAFVSMSLTCNMIPRSMGLYAAVASCSSLVTAVLLFHAQAEAITRWQWVGLCISTGGLVLGCVSNKTEAELDAVVVAVLSLFLVSARHFLTRKAQLENLDSTTAGVVTNLAHGFTGVLAWTFWSISFDLQSVDSGSFLKGVAAGVLMAVSSYCLNLSIFIGPAGPAALLSSLYLSTLSLSDYGASEFDFDLSKIPSLFIVSVGVAIMLLGDWLCTQLGLRRYAGSSTLRKPLLTDYGQSI